MKFSFRLLVVALFFFNTSCVFSINKNDSTAVIYSDKNDSIPHKKATKEEKRFLRIARKDLADEKYEKAKVNYLKLIELNPNSDIYNYETGLSFYFSVFERSTSISYFKNAISNSHHDTIPELNYYLGRAYHLNGEFENSKKTLLEFERKIQEQEQYLLQEVKYRNQLNDNGIDFLKKKDPNIIIKNLGTGINTIDREYAPIYRKDFNIIIFTSRRKGTTGGNLAADKLPYEDIYVAKGSSPESWSLITDKTELSKYLPSGYNTNKHNAGVVYSIDGKTLYLYKKDMLWKSIQENDKWGELEKLDKNVNESKLNIPSATISPDGNTVYFVSTRKDGLGGKDIYKITKDTNSNEWNKPENLGAEINTKFDEDAPFLSNDGKVFYFSSKGHKGIGGYDIYKCDIVDGNLSKPINMGVPINSPVNDIYLVIADKNQIGFFSSDREGGHGAMDLYGFEILCSNIENTEIRGIVYNKTDQVILESVLTLYDTNNTQVYKTKSLASNGKFLIPTPPDQKYKLTVETNGYEQQSFDISLPKQCEFFPLFIEIALETVPLDGKIHQVATIHNSFFNAEEAIADAQEKGTNIDTENITKNVPLTKVDTDTNFETDKNLLAFTRTIDANNTPLNFSTYSDTIVIKTSDKDTPLYTKSKVYQEEFGYNKTKINTNNKGYLALIDKAISKMNKTGKKIIINIESSASHVPTKTYKNNIHLASIRGEKAKNTIIKSLLDKNVQENMIEVSSINAIVSGPEYKKDYTNSKKYAAYQYVKINIE